MSVVSLRLLSPSGLHYGHWKSLLHDDDLFLPYGLMIIFAGKFGVPPSQWEEAVQPIIEKDPGNPKITKMRNLCLLDSAMNMLFPIVFGHQMLHKASKLGILSQYQFGAHCGHMAIGAVFLKHISYDLCQLMCALLIVVDKDARACFNQMVPSQCLILANRAGVDQSTMTVHRRVSRQMKYQMKSTYGISPGCIQTTLTDTILGMMQGSAAVGALWELVSSMLFAILKSRCPATHFPSSPNVRISTERSDEAYIDDTTLWILAMAGSMHLLLRQAEQQAQTWERLLWTTGGALNLKKCFWYYIDWKWTATGAPEMKMISNTPGQHIRLTQGDNRADKVSLERIEVSEGWRTLSMRLDPQGNDKMEYQYRMEQAQDICQRLQRAQHTEKRQE